jgi:hypothetical protein
VSALEAVQADATAPAEGVEVPLVTDEGEFTVTVPKPGKWKTRANTMLKDGDFDGWAKLVLSGADFDVWVEADPTNEDVEHFFEAWSKVSGEAPGESSRSSTSSRSTRRK